MATPTSRLTISIPTDVYERAKLNADARGFSISFSAYVSWLLKRDDAGDVQREDLAKVKKTTPKTPKRTSVPGKGTT